LVIIWFLARHHRFAQSRRFDGITTIFLAEIRDF
jgi:hypothetical protein